MSEARKIIRTVSTFGVLSGALIGFDGTRRLNNPKESVEEYVRSAYRDAHGSDIPEEEVARVVDETIKNGFFVPTYELPMYDDAGEPVYDGEGNQMMTQHTFRVGDYNLPEDTVSDIAFAKLEQVGGIGLLAASALILWVTRRKGA